MSRVFGLNWHCSKCVVFCFSRWQSCANKSFLLSLDYWGNDFFVLFRHFPSLFIPFFLMSFPFNSVCFLLAISDAIFGQIGAPSPILRPKRQSFSRYICGIPPFIFHSDIPCSYWAICLNHGFATNLPCMDTQNCLERNLNTECVQGTCCTLPNVQKPMPSMVIPTTPQLLPISSASLAPPNSFPIALILFPFSLFLLNYYNFHIVM